MISSSCLFAVLSPRQARSFLTRGVTAASAEYINSVVAQQQATEWMQRGRAMLTTLRKQFVPLAGFDYQRGASSHAWTATTIKSALHRQLIELCADVTQVLETEPTLLRLAEPAYVDSVIVDDCVCVLSSASLGD